ncbi:response regulator transcription factor [Streptococcus hongkongensis]|nr:AraC family transcriptional regulator [Streptococcus uberis]
MYKVLLVDDEYMILQGLQLIIDWQSLGFEVIGTAKSAKEALRLLSDIRVDLMISDVNMPEMTGLQLIEEATKLYPNLQTMILSGYQEFDFVKRAIELESRAYLLKPINKDELKEKLVTVKNTLDQHMIERKKQTGYDEYLVKQWLLDELSESDFEEHLANKYQLKNTSFTVLYIDYARELENLRSYFKQNMQELPLVITQDKKVFYAILVGNRLLIKSFVEDLQQTFQADLIQLILAETVTDWENVYDSYNQVQSHLFYNKQVKGSAISHTIFPSSELQFLSFNKALMIGDKPTILSKLDAIFEEMAELGYSPEDVKHVSFLLFLDIYRKFPILDKTTYSAMLETIHTSKHIDRIQSELVRLLELTSQDNPPQKRFSELVSETISYITQSYSEDLSLKYVADKLHVNGVYLGQCFKNETEQSFAQYLNQVRIQKAQQLLLYTNHSISEIAFEIGYNTNHYFIKMFKKLNGLSPKEFRDCYRDNYYSINDNKN